MKCNNCGCRFSDECNPIKALDSIGKQIVFCSENCMNLSTEEISEVELSASKAAQEYEVFKRETCKLPDFIAANACIDFLRGVEWLLNYQKENPQARDSVKNGGDEG